MKARIEKDALISKAKQEKTYYNELLAFAKIIIEVLKSFENKTVNKRLITKTNDLLTKENHNMHVYFADFFSNVWKNNTGYKAMKICRHYLDGRSDYDFNNKDLYFHIYIENNKLLLDETIQGINEFIASYKDNLIAINNAVVNYDSYIQMINDLNDHIKTFNLNYNRYICDRVFI